jgi:two-component system response regulator AtoC
MEAKILICDDEEKVHYSFRKILPKEYDLFGAMNGEEALKIIRNNNDMDLVILDIKMPGMSGLETLAGIKKIAPKIPVIIMTAYGTTSTAIEAMKLGAYEYLLKPFDIPQMQTIIKKALRAGRLMREKVRIDSSIKKIEDKDALIGNSDAMQEVYKLIGKVAGNDVTVLIQGETGSGKELVARAIYHHSKRSNKSFMVVNCAAIPETLLESELFGHEKGAFTGATNQRIGIFESSNGGTIFLDEIGEMPLSLQSKILRFLQDCEITRLGGNKTIKVDIRLIAATHKNLKKELKENKFREDLYYRLNVFTIFIPPLRDRKNDIPLLVRYFMSRFSAQIGKSVERISPRAIKKLIEHNWPGNVRELENTINRAMIICPGNTITEDVINIAETIDIDSLMEMERESISLLRSLIQPVFDEIVRLRSAGSSLNIMEIIEKELIHQALMKTNNNQLRAATLLGISRNTLRSRTKKFYITRSQS